MNICPNCRAAREMIVELDEYGAEVFICTTCDAIQVDVLVLTRDEAKLLSTHLLESAFIPRDFYAELQPIVMKIIKFADTGRES